ncbi:MAG: hypothetical protein ACJAYJ_003506 [Saprospiraceae bacterium]|jgi:hypothetical protein
MLGVGELTCRLIGIHPYEKYPSPPPYNTALKDNFLDWKMSPNYTFSGKVKDSKNEEYQVNLKYDEHGFKAYGDPNSTKKKVFFIGDSYTASVEVSNDKTFFNLLKDSLDLEVFAYGQSAWGTFQQYLVFNKYINIIQPDLVVWQTTSNDFMDNYAPLEMESGYSVEQRRRYLTKEGNTVYYRPISFTKKIAEYSSFMRFLEDKWKNISYNYLNKNKRIAEHFIVKRGKEYEPYARSIEVTNLILDKKKAELPEKTRLIGFSSSLFEPQARDFKEIFNNHGFEYTMTPAKLVNKGEYHKETVRSSDGYHWNERGHELIANGLIKFMKE